MNERRSGDKSPGVNESGDRVPEEANNLDEDTYQRTIEARGALYTLIARFRKDAAQTDNREAQRAFEFAAEVIAGVTRAFRRFEDDNTSEPSNRDDQK